MTRAKKQEHLQSPQEAARVMEVSRKRKIVTDKFYPALTSATVSVEEAKMLVRAFSSVIMEEVMRTMQERKLEEIKEKVLKSLCPDGAREAEVKALIETITSETLYVAREIVEGMSNAIDQMVMEDMQNRTLNSFTPDWEKMLNK